MLNRLVRVFSFLSTDLSLARSILSGPADVFFLALNMAFLTCLEVNGHMSGLLSTGCAGG